MTERHNLVRSADSLKKSDCPIYTHADTILSGTPAIARWGKERPASRRDVVQKGLSCERGRLEERVGWQTGVAMRRPNALVVLCVVLSGTISGWSQSPPLTGGLVSRINWVRFEILLGRFTVISSRYGPHRFASPENDDNEVHETLTVNGDAQFADIRYERITPEQYLLVEHHPRRTTTIHQDPRGDSKLSSLRFTQTARGKLTLVVHSPASRRQYSANSIWHLLLAEPELYRTELVPIFDLLRPDWRLIGTAEQIEASLFTAAQNAQPHANEQVSRLVAELAHSSFKRRQAADRDLRALGLTALPALNRLKASEIDAEQRMRIKRIEESFDLQTGDTPERVATWLLEDRTIWVALLAHRDTVKRQAAAQYLNGVCPAPIGFNPLATEEQRRQQIERLQEQFARN